MLINIDETLRKLKVNMQSESGGLAQLDPILQYCAKYLLLTINEPLSQIEVFSWCFDCVAAVQEG